MSSVHNTTQNSSDNLCSYLQTIIIAQMLSIGGEWDETIHIYSSREWTMLKRLSSSEVKGQGHDQTN